MLAISRLFDYSIYMQIVGISFPPMVNVSELQRGVSPVGLQPTPETGRTSPALRSGRTPASPTTVVPGPTPAVSQSSSSLTALQRQLFEFGLRIVTGGFSRLVVDILRLTPATPPPLVTEKPALNNRPESVSPVVNMPTPQTSIAAPIPMETPLSANQSAPREATPVVIEAPFGIHPENAQATAVNPPTPAQASPASPVPAIVTAVSEVARSAPLQQHGKHRLDIFDSQSAVGSRAGHPHTLTGTLLDRTA
ncbi:MAG: hypothetical protein BMS9Abin18_0819 [Zetaproteobacteria bacterium]|nr:MAG: hypothetical protein BMS9Abin18_0819 [Zetaproteobacteria bacterium]